jgi:hypothetical protein
MCATQENLCICGPSGTGKSHFCEAFGRAAVEARVWFAAEYLGVLVGHRADDSITRVPADPHRPERAAMSAIRSWDARDRGCHHGCERDLGRHDREAVHFFTRAIVASGSGALA